MTIHRFELCYSGAGLHSMYCKPDHKANPVTGDHHLICWLAAEERNDYRAQFQEAIAAHENIL